MKFKDTLTGRKASIWLTPMVAGEGKTLGSSDLQRRLKHGGLPPFFLSNPLDEGDFQEWMDSFWAKDVLELFRLERRASFLKFAELLLCQSGGIFEATSFATPCEVSRPTIASYLAILHETYFVHVVRPFHSRKPTEITSAPKVFGFDTGFISNARGLEKLRPTDQGNLWEHLVLNELQAHLQDRSLIHYWRDKQKHEVDFIVVPKKSAPPVAIEAKLNAREFDPSNLAIFRRLHPEGANYVVAADVDRPVTRTLGGLEIKFLSLSHIGESASSSRS